MDKKGAITNEIKVESQNINLWCHRKEYNKRWYNLSFGINKIHIEDPTWVQYKSWQHIS